MANAQNFPQQPIQKTKKSKKEKDVPNITNMEELALDAEKKQQLSKKGNQIVTELQNGKI